MRKSGIAFFDLDGTITTKDTYLEFIKFVVGVSAFYNGIVVLSPFIILHFLKLYPNDKLKERFFFYYFQAYSPEQLEELGRKFAENILPTLCTTKALDKIRWHQQQGHRVIILTASSAIWLGKWCKNLNLEIIGTQFEVQGNRYTGKILGKNCYGAEKQKHVEKILSENQYDDSYGYGDSKSDLLFMNCTKYHYFGLIQ